MGGALYVVDDTHRGAMNYGVIDDPTAPGAAVLEGTFHPVSRPSRHHVSRRGALRGGLFAGTMNYGG